MHRFYAPVKEGRAQLTRSQWHQVRHVLRLGQGDRLAVFDGSGQEWLAELHGSAADLLKEVEAPAEPRTRLTLFQALIRPAKFELVLQKATELGVTRFVPFRAERSVATGDRLPRWHTILVEAAEQSGRRIVPGIAAPLSFDQAIVEATSQSVPFMPWEGADRPRLSSVHRPSQDLALIVGPEGGFTAEEVDRARSRGALTVTLGRRILRSETAAIAAVAVLMHLNGEL